MKNYKNKIILIVLCLILLLLASCKDKGSTYSEPKDAYHLEESYVASFSDKTLDINWQIGNIMISQSDDTSFHFNEYTTNDLNEKEKTRIYESNDTLYVKYAKSGYENSSISKDLTIDVPAGETIKFNITIDEGNLIFCQFEGSDYEINITKGDVLMTNVVEIPTGQIFVNVHEGSIILENCYAKTVYLYTETGDISFTFDLSSSNYSGFYLATDCKTENLTNEYTDLGKNKYGNNSKNLMDFELQAQNGTIEILKQK